MPEPIDVKQKSAEELWDLVVELGEAVERGDFQSVAALISQGADTEAVMERDDPTVLMRAAEAGNLDVVRTLEEGGANVNSQANDEDLDRFLDDDAAEAAGSSVSALLYAALKQHRTVYNYLYPRTEPALRREVERVMKVIRRLRKPIRDRRLKALTTAVEQCKLDAIRDLLGAGVEVNAQDKQGTTALAYAAALKQRDAVDLLLDAGADPTLATNEGMTPLHMAVDPDVARTLLDAGADPNARANYDQTPLMFAALRGPAELIRTLIGRGADVDATDSEGKTAVIYGVERGMKDNVAALIDAGAGLWAQDQSGLTAYRLARRKNAREIAELLQAAGAIRETTRQYFSAAADGRIDEVSRLLAAGLDVHDRFEPEPDFEMSALHVAARAGHVDVARALIAASADIHGKTFHLTDPDRRDLTPLMFAAMAGHAEVLRILIEAGARIDARTIYSNAETPLMRAADAGHLEAVRVLLEAGADRQATGGTENLDALTRAERKGHREVAGLLRSAGA